MIADEHAMILRGLRDLLEGHSNVQVVGEAASPEAALSVAREMGPAIAIIGYSFGPSSGRDLTIALKQAVPPILVLVHTRLASDETLIEAVDAGASGFVLK